MSFADAKPVVASPIELYLDWKGKDSDGFFSSYNKEAWVNEKYELGKCAIVNIGFTVKWFNEAMNTSVYSNKIAAWDEEVIVRSKWDVLAQWMWKDIRDQVSGFWGSIHKAITLLDLWTGKLIEIYLKWQAGWGIIDKETKKNIWWGFTDVEAKAKRKMNVADKVYPIIVFVSPKLIKGKAFSYNVPEFDVLEDEILEGEQINKYLEVCKTFDDYKIAATANKNTKKEAPIDTPVSESFDKPGDVTTDDIEMIFDDTIPF